MWQVRSDVNTQYFIYVNKMHGYLRQKANQHLGWYLYESVWLTTNAGQLPGHYLENVCGVFLEVSVWTVDWWARALSSPESPSRSQRLTPQHWRTHLAAVIYNTLTRHFCDILQQLRVVPCCRRSDYTVSPESLLFTGKTCF